MQKKELEFRAQIFLSQEKFNIQAQYNALALKKKLQFGDIPLINVYCYT